MNTKSQRIFILSYFIPFAFFALIFIAWPLGDYLASIEKENWAYPLDLFSIIQSLLIIVGMIFILRIIYHSHLISLNHSDKGNYNFSASNSLEENKNIIENMKNDLIELEELFQKNFKKFEEFSSLLEKQKSLIDNIGNSTYDKAFAASDRLEREKENFNILWDKFSKEINIISDEWVGIFSNISKENFEQNKKIIIYQNEFSDKIERLNNLVDYIDEKILAFNNNFNSKFDLIKNIEDRLQANKFLITEYVKNLEYAEKKIDSFEGNISKFGSKNNVSPQFIAKENINQNDLYNEINSKKNNNHQITNIEQNNYKYDDNSTQEENLDNLNLFEIEDREAKKNELSKIAKLDAKINNEDIVAKPPENYSNLIRESKKNAQIGNSEKKQKLVSWDEILSSTDDHANVKTRPKKKELEFQIVDLFNISEEFENSQEENSQNTLAQEIAYNCQLFSRKLVLNILPDLLEESDIDFSYGRGNAYADRIIDKFSGTNEEILRQKIKEVKGLSDKSKEFLKQIDQQLDKSKLNENEEILDNFLQTRIGELYILIGIAMNYF